MYCSSLGALYSGAAAWPLLLPQSSPAFTLRIPAPPSSEHSRRTPPLEGKLLILILFFNQFYQIIYYNLKSAYYTVIVGR